MDVKVLYINGDGYPQEHSESADSIKMFSLKTATKELTDAKLAALIDGADNADGHTHDGRYFRENEFISTSAGVADANKPAKTNASGYVNDLIDTATLNAALDHGTLSGLGDDDHTIYTKADGTRAFTGAQSMGGFKLTNVADPSAGTDAVNLQTLQAYQQGMKPKEAVRAATTVAGTLATSFEAGDIIDGVTLVAGNRILIKDQAAPEENGIYVVQASGAPVRAADMNIASEVPGSYTMVQEGSAHAGKGYVQTGAFTTLGVDAINFVFYNAADAITASTGLTRVVNDIQLASSSAGDGLSFTAGVLAVKVAAAGGLEISSDEVQIKADGVKDTMIDFGTGAGQVSAVDVPIADAGNYTAQTEVEGALQELYGMVSAVGVSYTVGVGGVTKGYPVYISANDTVLAYTALSNTARIIGVAATTEAAAATVKVLANDTVVTGVLSGATAGTPYYWDGSALVTAIPGGGGSHVWKIGEAKNATDLHVEVEFIKKN